MRDRIVLVLSAAAYLLFHLRLGPDPATVAAGTFSQLLHTAPYAIGLTYLLAVFIRHASGGIWPPWDRLARIFFTFGILLAFFFALYEYADRGQKKQDRPPLSGVRIWLDDIPMVPLYWA